jgi:putative cell wall-binding protein
VVYDEIVRLQPENIVVVGGVGAVSESVEEALSRIAPVTRIAGANRYAVSRSIARTFFADGAEVAMVASGADFPDALSAGSFAGAIGAPVILIDPHAESLDSGTAGLLRDLGVRAIYVMGGTGAVSQSLAAQLARIPGVDFLTRRGGVDRFETSAFTPAAGFYDEVFIANGFGFADALAGTWLAAGLGAPVLLVQRDCIPFGASLLHDAQTVYALGGAASLSPENLGALPAC